MPIFPQKLEEPRIVRILGPIVLIAILLLLFFGSCAAPQSQRTVHEERARPNVLFVIADDLGAQALGCYGNEQCKTPVIDALAARSTRFTRAYCQFPVCGPSRAALMSGMYPQSLGITGNGRAPSFAKALGARPTMTQAFMRAGYEAIRVSKIYHMRVPGDITRGVHGPDHAASWSERYSVHAPEWRSAGQSERLSNERLRMRDPSKHYNLGFGTAFYSVQTPDGSGQADTLAAARAIEILERKHTKPWFLALGFVRPHVPLVAPRAQFARYDTEKLELAKSVPNDHADIPRAGLSKTSKRSGITSDAQKRRILRAYYASVSFLDEQLGRVLDALERSGQAANTIVVFTSDHGYHLGEHEFWQKLSLHEESTRIPLLIHVPGQQPARSASLAQQIDLYPTLCELAGLELPPHLQGASLAGVLEDPSKVVHEAVYCSKRGGDLVRNQRFALLDWHDGSAELYDMHEDPLQFTNLAGAPESRELLRQMRARLRAHQRLVAR